MATKEKTPQAKFKPFALRFEFHDPEEVDIFLRGCILASQNNNSHLWTEVIDGINDSMEQYRADKLHAELAVRAAAGMP
jgi:hypothetical protein